MNNEAKLNYFPIASEALKYCSRVQKFNVIYAVTCDFQQCGSLTSVDSDEPVQLPFKLKSSKWYSGSR